MVIVIVKSSGRNLYKLVLQKYSVGKYFTCKKSLILVTVKWMKVTERLFEMHL